MSRKVNRLIIDNDRQGLQELAESRGGWPALLAAYPDLLYNTLLPWSPWLEPETVLFLLDKGAGSLPYPAPEGSYFHLSFLLASRDEGFHPVAARLIPPDPDVRWTDEKGRGYLHHICAKDYPFSLELAEQLIRSGADVDAPDGSGKTPLLLAVTSNQTDLTALLLRHNQTLIREDPEILFRAVKNDNLEILLMLLERGMDINDRGWEDKTLVVRIFSHAHIKPTKELLAFLMNHQADLTIPDVYGDTLLHHALRNPDGRPLVPALLEYGAPVNAVNHKGEAPLHLVRSAAMADLLLRAGADPNAKTKEGQTPLSIALFFYRRDFALFRSLIEGGADVNGRDEDGRPYLFRAAGKPDQTRFLLVKGADPHQQSSAGRSILFPYASLGSPAVWHFFPFAEDQINSKDNQGYTPLHLALQHGRYDFAFDLIRKGADYLAKDDKGQRPVDAFLNDRHLLREIQSETPELHAFFLGSPDFGAEYQAKIDRYLQEDRERKQAWKVHRISAKLLALGLPLLWLAASFWARGKAEQDVWGGLNGIVLIVVSCSAAAGLLFAAFTPSAPDGVVLDISKGAGFVLGAVLGAVGGLIGGIILRERFAESQWLYSAAPVLASLGGLYYTVFH